MVKIMRSIGEKVQKIGKMCKYVGEKKIYHSSVCVYRLADAARSGSGQGLDGIMPRLNWRNSA